MTRTKLGSLTSALAVSWIAACGSSFEGGDGEGGSSGRAGSAAGGQSGGDPGGGGKGGNTGKGGDTGSEGGNGPITSTGGDTASSGGEGVIGEGGAHTGMAGASSGVAGAPSTTSCRVGALENVLFCDDFEDPELSGWSRIANGGEDGLTEHVSDPVHFGTGAVKSTKYSFGSLDPLFTDALGEHNGGKLYARVWMYIPASVTISNVPLANASLFVLGEAPPNDGGVSVVMWANSKVTVQVWDPPVSTQAGSFTTPLPRDQWFCLRLDFPIGSGSKSDYHLRIGNELLASAEPDALVESTLSGPYERLWVGVNYISPEQENAVTVYYDDVAVDTQDLPCD